MSADSDAYARSWAAIAEYHRTGYWPQHPAVRAQLRAAAIAAVEAQRVDVFTVLARIPELAR